MHLDILFPIIFVIFIFLIQVVKILTSKKSDSPFKKSEGKERGWKKALSDIATQIAREIEAAKAETAGKPPVGWDQIAPPQQITMPVETSIQPQNPPRPSFSKGGSSRSIRKSGAMPVYESEEGKDSVENWEREIPLALPSEKIEGKKPPAKEKIMKPALPGKTRIPVGSLYGRKKLRNAIVWAEILAPPLALRDDQE